MSRPADVHLPRPRLVVVGSGMAATRLVERLVLRNATSAWDITVLGDEDAAPYNRILLSAVLEGTHRPEALTLRSPQWYDGHGVALRRGTRVQAIDRQHKSLALADGTTLGYDTLVLATGSIATLPPIRGLIDPEHGGLHDAVHAFRSLADCERLLAAVTATDGTGEILNRRAVVVGGGLLGLQVARALGTRGVDTEIVEGGEHLLHRQITGAAGRILARDLARLGVAVYTGARATRLRQPAAQTSAQTSPQTSVLTHGSVRVLDPLPRNPGRIALQLDNGFTLDTDLVVLTAGGRPSTGLARSAGLEVARGIVVDDRLASVTEPSIHAIGDCAEPRCAEGSASGFVPPAWEQADVLARVLSGDDATYDGSRIVARLRATDLEVAVLGDEAAELARGGEVVEVANPIAGSHRRLVVRDRRIVAATLVGDLGRVGLITQHFDRRTVLGAREPGALLMPERSTAPGNPAHLLPDDAEVCACAGVSAGRIRGCSSLGEVRDITRATTGCGGCTATVRALLDSSTPAPSPKGTQR